MRTDLPSIDLLKHPTAWLPLAMSLGALLLFLSSFRILAPLSHAGGDAGLAAYTYQLLMSLQIPLVLLCSALWLPKDPRRTLLVLALQAVAWLAAFLPVLLTRI